MREKLKAIYEVFCALLVVGGLGVGLWSWGYWVGKNDTMATMAVIKEAKK
jgi:hypothetical protein